MANYVIPIFKSGTHADMSGRSQTYTDTAVRAIVAGFNAYPQAFGGAPLCLGHPRDNEPRFGEVKALSEAGGILFAAVEPAVDLVEAVHKGAYKYVSASFYTPDWPGNPTPLAYFLKHVGFLGATPPAVKGLGPVHFADMAGSMFGIPASFGDAMENAWKINGRRHRPSEIYAAARVIQSALPGASFADAAAFADRLLPH